MITIIYSTDEEKNLLEDAIARSETCIFDTYEESTYISCSDCYMNCRLCIREHINWIKEANNDQ